MSKALQADRTGSHSSWLKRVIIIAIILLPLGLLTQAFIYLRMAGGGELSMAIAEADKQDPRWRLDDVLSDRKVLPDEENSALIVTAVVGLERPGTAILPDGWPDQKLDKSLSDLPPDVQLSDLQLTLLRDELKKAEAGLTLIRRVADMPNGRYPLDTSGPNPFAMLLPHVQGVRRGAMLLRYDAMVLAQDGKMEEAMKSCRASINTIRSLGDEPLMISMLVRCAGRAITLQTIERILAQGEASPESLATLQEMLEKELAEPLFLYASRGERAFCDKVIAGIDSGAIPASEAMKMMDTGVGMGGNETAGNLIGNVLMLFAVGTPKQNRAALLKYNNQVVEIARRPAEEQTEDLKRLEDGVKEMPRMAQMMAAAVGKVHEAHLRDQAAMRCALVAVAVERFRLKHGRWPNALAELSPEFLSAIPKDPRDKKPIKLARLKDSVVIYSIGQNGVDDGGRIDRLGKLVRLGGGRFPDTDAGFQLWDASMRRRPPLPGQGEVKDED